MFKYIDLYLPHWSNINGIQFFGNLRNFSHRAACVKQKHFSKVCFPHSYNSNPLIVSSPGNVFNFPRNSIFVLFFYAMISFSLPNNYISSNILKSKKIKIKKLYEKRKINKK